MDGDLTSVVAKLTDPFLVRLCSVSLRSYCGLRVPWTVGARCRFVHEVAYVLDRGSNRCLGSVVTLAKLYSRRRRVRACGVGIEALLAPVACLRVAKCVCYEADGLSTVATENR